MIEVTDQVGNLVSLQSPAERIISLVPSQTELLHFFGLKQQTIGITKFCIHPSDWHHNKERIGGTKNLDLAKIKLLSPDLIIANKEENTKEQIEELKKNFQVYVSDVNTVQDAYAMIKGVGLLTDCEQKAVDLIDDIQDDFEEIKKIRGTVLYFIWKDPYMVCGADNFIHSILTKIGLLNVICESRYIELTETQISELNPDYIFLSTEPYPFNETHLAELQKITNAEVILVDGEMFSWYGSRMLKMKAYFKQLTQEIT